ncbi:MAG: hypothetical protein KMY49_21170 [Hoeflea sp.]|nr:hypothetical protein [Hoeflea sp.]
MAEAIMAMLIASASIEINIVTPFGAFSTCRPIPSVSDGDNAHATIWFHHSGSMLMNLR